MKNTPLCEQIVCFMTGNELVAQAAKAIQFHFLGFYPITPSTEIAQLIDSMNAMKTRGEVSTVLLAADGEHGAAGACYGASTAGARVLNATSANGFLYSLEQLPVQAGTRMPMVLNLVTRSVSGPLDIRCDHSDLVFALQTGWIILMAATPQAVYDLNILAVKLGEHPDVRLPVMVVSDGFFTSHQRQSAKIFSKVDDVQQFLASSQNCGAPYTTLDPKNPVTIGPYMNDRDLIQNKYQLHQAHEKAAQIFETISREYEALTGRFYPAIETHALEGAESALFLLNSAAETAIESVDVHNAAQASRVSSKRVGLIRPNILRPFPASDLKNLVTASALKSIVIGERSDTPGSQGGPIAHEVISVLAQEVEKPIKKLVRVFGLGGKDFTHEDVAHLIDEGLNADSAKPFAFMGNFLSVKKSVEPRQTQSVSQASLSESDFGIRIELISDPTSKAKVRAVVPEARFLTTKPKRIAPGHGACPGCGIFSGLDQFFKGISGDVVTLYHTGCAMVVTTDYPYSSHRVTYLHNLFQNGAPTLAGLVEVFHEKKRRGEIEAGTDITFVMVTGDGGMDIGMGPTIGTALRNHSMIILEYDNQGYMNTGGQLSYTTPFGKATSTSHVPGKRFHHKDTLSIMAATGIPYVFSAIEGVDSDLVAKAAKAQWYAKNKGLAFGKLLVSCPINWGADDKEGYAILQNAVNSCFFPLFEVENGLTLLNSDPEKDKTKVPVTEWLKMMTKSQHLLRPEFSDDLVKFQTEVDRRWARLKARAAHPLL